MNQHIYSKKLNLVFYLVIYLNNYLIYLKSQVMLIEFQIAQLNYFHTLILLIFIIAIESLHQQYYYWKYPNRVYSMANNLNFKFDLMLNIIYLHLVLFNSIILNVLHYSLVNQFQISFVSFKEILLITKVYIHILCHTFYYKLFYNLFRIN